MSRNRVVHQRSIQRSPVQRPSVRQNSLSVQSDCPDIQDNGAILPDHLNDPGETAVASPPPVWVTPDPADRRFSPGAKPRPYLIVTPWYRHSSAGIVVLHFLCHELNRLGFEAYLLILLQPKLPPSVSPVHPNWIAPILTMPLEENPKWQEIKDRVIVIYPETIAGNPTQAPCVVRYMLNREHPDRPIRAAQDDFIVSFSKAFMLSHLVLFLPVSLDISLFHDRGQPQERTQDMVWVGKGRLYGVFEKPDHAIEITNTWPPTRQALGDQLRKTRFLYSYDAMISIITESVLCGAVVIIKHFGPWQRRDLEMYELGLHGVAVDESPAEIERAIQTRLGLVDTVRRHVAAMPSRILAFADATQDFFRYHQ